MRPNEHKRIDLSGGGSRPATPAPSAGEAKGGKSSKAGLKIVISVVVLAGSAFVLYRHFTADSRLRPAPEAHTEAAEVTDRISRQQPAPPPDTGPVEEPGSGRKPVSSSP